ncbi:hypothetical protein [Citrobacter pasteurii]|uniref:hypothetical protein n=1 Tax=Citrobacter pasteurii TaxID=1563222 RepID=UPI001FF010A0|nr:hypothetical protein [Citrobacter pasteurii]
MTAIACWLNREENDSIWAVSDSRITQQNSTLTDHCPKLFSIPVSVIRSSDVYRIQPQKIFEFGFGFSGSTIIGINVKEMLAVSLSRLHEMGNSNPEQEIPHETYPTLSDIAVLAKNIAEKFMHDVGQSFPQAVIIEMLIFGFCLNTRTYKIIKLSNSSVSPNTINIEDHQDLSSGTPILLGNRQQELQEFIETTREQFAPNTINWWRSPFIALNNWINQGTVNTIGGYIQMVTAFPFFTRLSFLTNLNGNNVISSHAGINTTESFGPMIGGFILMPMDGMSLPGENGWDVGNQITRVAADRVAENR